jgi:predicted RNase H-related nuclease YkuK (DUF458 family)
MRMKKKSAKSEKSGYHITLTVDNDVYKADGATLMAALTKLKPTHYKARGFFRLEHKGNIAEVRMSGLQLQRIFIKEADRALLAKRLMVSL